MEAYVIVGTSVFDLIEGLVNDAIKDGYVPIGGIVSETCYNKDEGWTTHNYMQAMYKKPTKPVKPRNEANDITELDLSKRTINMLLSEGIDIDTLRTMSEIDLLKLPGCGRGTTNEILNELYRDGGMK